MQPLSRRTHTCGALRAEHAGQTVTLQGWVHFVRNQGQLIFIVLRDRYGTVQITVNDDSPADVLATADKARLEYVLEVTGEVRLRGEGLVNAKMATGEIEVSPTSIRILSQTKPLPFKIGNEATKASDCLLYTSPSPRDDR